MLIWLLEDDPAQAELLSGWLTSAGHEIQHFDRGELILDALPEGKFDLIIFNHSASTYWSRTAPFQSA